MHWNKWKKYNIFFSIKRKNIYREYLEYFILWLEQKKIDVIHIPNQTLTSILILLIGILILIIPVSKFIKSKTTIDPIKFKKVNKLVTSGIYKYSRNPMYLGLLLIVISSSILYLNI